MTTQNNIDLAFEVQNYFSKNNFRSVELAELTLPQIHEHAKKLDWEIKYQGETSDIREEMINFVQVSLGIK